MLSVRTDSNENDEGNVCLKSLKLGNDGEVIKTGDEHVNRPNFQNIKVTNSEDVYLGNKSYFQHPVTVEQIIRTVDEKTDNSNNQEETTSDCDKNHSHSSQTTENNNTNTPKGKKTVQTVLIIVMTICLIGAAVSLTVILTNTDVTSSEENYDSFKLTFVDRKSWKAEDAKDKLNILPIPVPYVIIHHTASENCTTTESCKSRVLLIQKFHVYSNGWWDIGYNFMVGGDGLVYVGRGWNSEGAHAKGYNKNSIGIAFLGTFNEVLPPQKQIFAAKKLIEYGLEKGYVDKNYKLLAVRNVSPTKSPGDKLSEELKTWPHWSIKP